MTKWLLIGAITWTSVFATTVSLVRVNKVAAQTSKKLQAIVRLHSPTDGHFFCSGVVVGAKTIITAAHCVTEYAAGERAAEVRSEDGQGTNNFAYLVNASGQADYAILKGDFSNFEVAPMDFKPADIVAGMKEKVVACGYPYSGKLFCVEVLSLHQNRFSFSGAGVLYPGMSGGPVFNMSTGHVIAVNSAVMDTEVILAPLIEIYANLQTTPE